MRKYRLLCCILCDVLASKMQLNCFESPHRHAASAAVSCRGCCVPQLCQNTGLLSVYTSWFCFFLRCPFEKRMSVCIVHTQGISRHTHACQPLPFADCSCSECLPARAILSGPTLGLQDLQKCLPQHSIPEIVPTVCGMRLQMQSHPQQVAEAVAFRRGWLTLVERCT